LSSYLSRLHRFSRLTAADRHLLIEATVVLVAIRAALALLSFPALLRLRARLGRKPFQCGASGHPAISRVVWAVDVISRLLHLNGCLIRAITVDTMLIRHQRPSQLRIGVVKGADAALEAHAWVESNGEVIVGGGDLDRFTPLAAFGRS
jgi:hypothetical protein